VISIISVYVLMGCIACTADAFASVPHVKVIAAPKQQGM
jgi:hypothetical protein